RAVGAGGGGRVPAPVRARFGLRVAAPLLTLKVKPAKGTPRPAESMASALSATVLPASTGAVLGVTSQLETCAAVGAATQAPPEQICPALQSESLPQAGGRPGPGSQTRPRGAAVGLRETATAVAPAAGCAR